MRWLLFLLLALSGAAEAEEAISVCFNYGCAAEAVAVFADSQLDWVREMLEGAMDPGGERAQLALVLGQLYAWAGDQTPIHNDRGGNMADEGVHGAMDCIDHTTTTTRLLQMLERKGWLRYHRLLPQQRRSLFIINEHYSAAIEEVGPVRELVSTKQKPKRYAVDSWFVDNGRPAVILPLDEWLRWGGPNVY